MSTHRLFRVVPAAAGAALLAACASGIHSERDESIPVPHGATWAWGRTGNLPDTGRYIRRGPQETADPIVQQRFRRAIEAAMEARGLRLVADSAQPDFVLIYGLEDTYGGEGRGDGYGYGPASTSVAVGLGWGWGYGPRGFYRPFGLYRPFGFYQPWGFYPWGWGWSAFGSPFFGAMWAPVYPVGYRSYGGYGGQASLVIELRQRSSGEVAWTGRYHLEPRAARRMSQEQVQEVVNKLFADLR